MIIFHEGMPRSGKSYCAIKDHLIPALQKGRKCYVRIDGLDYSKISELSGRTIQELEVLLYPLSEENCENLQNIEFDKDSFLLIDEAQNYWPTQRKPLDSRMMKWVAEHGHHGFDVLLMGQLAKDVHSAWVNRVNRKIQFIKKDVVGKPNHYKWIMFHGSPDARGNVRFREVSRGDAEYDKKYFGSYKSHSDGTENTETYADDRANVFKSPVFRKWIPFYLVAVVFGLGYIIYFFSGGAVKKPEKAPTEAQVQKKSKVEVEYQSEAQRMPAAFSGGSGGTVQYREGRLVGTQPEIVPANQVQPELQSDYVEMLTSRYRVRLSGVVQTQRGMFGHVEWRDEAGAVHEKLSIRDISSFGWLVLISPEGSVGTMQRGNKRFILTQWPLEEYRGRVNDVRESTFKPPQVVSN